MTKGSLLKVKQHKVAPLERGIQLDVPDRALIAQAAAHRVAQAQRSSFGRG